MSVKWEIHQFREGDIYQLIEFNSDGGSVEGRVVAESHLIEDVINVKKRHEAERDSHSFADIQPALKEVKPDERPNKYSILQSDTGKWQIVKKTEKDGHWMVYVKDCGTKRLAVLMLNAIMQSAKEGTPEQRIMSASDG